ncbi:hypothetical protein Tco_0421841 [Tanacetum coccineum]
MFRIRFKEDDELVFTCRAWWKAFKVKEDVYKEWCLEFFFTLWVDEQIKVENITSEVCIWFRLCGRNYDFTLLNVAVLLGLYMEDEIKEQKFGAYLEAGEMNFDKFTIRIVKNLGLFVPLEIKKCSPLLKSGWLDKKAFAGLIDKETNALLPPDEDDEDEQEIKHEEDVEQEEQVEQEAPVFLEVVPLPLGRGVTVYISPPPYLVFTGLGNVVVVVDVDFGSFGSFGNGSSSGCHGGLWWLIENEEDDEMVLIIWREII